MALAWRKMRLFMWLGNSLLKSAAVFRHSGFSSILETQEHSLP